LIASSLSVRIEAGQFASKLAGYGRNLECESQAHDDSRNQMEFRVQEWFCARCGRKSDHLIREDARIKIEVFPCELYQHVIDPDPGEDKSGRPCSITSPSLRFADNFAQLLDQIFRGERKLDKLTGLEFDIAALQIRLYGLAKLIGDTNTFSRQD
jgi:hypothetical protein